jgi:hypothetical protein
LSLPLPALPWQIPGEQTNQTADPLCWRIRRGNRTGEDQVFAALSVPEESLQAIVCLKDADEK